MWEVQANYLAGSECPVRKEQGFACFLLGPLSYLAPPPAAAGSEDWLLARGRDTTGFPTPTLAHCADRNTARAWEEAQGSYTGSHSLTPSPFKAQAPFIVGPPD